MANDGNKSYLYEAGQRCFGEGKTLVDNPYFPWGRRDHNSVRGDKWDDGWWDAYWANRRKTETHDGE